MPAKSQQQQIDAANENILVIVGRLLAATEAASDGLKVLSEETKQNSAGVLAVKTAVEGIQQTVAELDRLVRTGTVGGVALVTQVKLNSDAVAQLRQDHGQLEATVNEQGDSIAELEKGNVTAAASHTSAKSVILYVVGVVAWAITTGIALYAALKGK